MKATIIVGILAAAGAGFGAGFMTGRESGPEGASGVPDPEGKTMIGRVSAPAPASATASAPEGGGAGFAMEAPPAQDASDGEKEGYVKAVAARDPQRAIAWAQANAEESDRDDLFQVIAEAWARTEPEKAFSWANGLSRAREREQAIRGTMAGALEGGHEAAALSFIETLPPGEYKDTATGAAVAHFAKTDLNRAFGLVEAMGETYAMRSASREMTKALIETGRVDELKQRLLNLPFGTVRREMLTGLVETLGDDDVKGALLWIAEQPTDAGGNAVLEGGLMRNLSYALARDFVKQADPKDVFEWAEKIGDERARQYFIQKVGEYWGGSEPGQAASFLIDTINRDGFEGIAKLSEGIFEEWIELDQNAPFDAIAGIRDPVARQRAAFMALRELASENPRVAAERLAEWEGADAAQAGQISSQLMQNWLRRDPEQASLWLSEKAAGPVRDSGIERLARSVMQEERDFDAARAWIAEVQDEPMRERLTQELDRYENPTNTIEMPIFTATDGTQVSGGLIEIRTGETVRHIFTGNGVTLSTKGATISTKGGSPGAATMTVAPAPTLAPVGK